MLLVVAAYCCIQALRRGAAQTSAVALIACTLCPLRRRLMHPIALPAIAHSAAFLVPVLSSIRNPRLCRSLHKAMSESSEDVPLAQLGKHQKDEEVKHEAKTQTQPEPRAEGAQNGAVPAAAAGAKQEDDGSSDEDAPLITRKAAVKSGELFPRLLAQPCLLTHLGAINRSRVRRWRRKQNPSACCSLRHRRCRRWPQPVLPPPCCCPRLQSLSLTRNRLPRMAARRQQ